MKKQNTTARRSRNNNALESQIIEKVIKKVESKKQDKFIEYNLNTTVGNAWVFLPVSETIVQGTTESQRIGNKIRLRHVTIRANFAVADTTNFVRLVAFRWRVSSTSDAPQNTEMFLPNASNAWYSSFLPLKPSRFQVVFDRQVSLSAQGLAATNYEVNIPLNWDTSYDVGVNTGKDHFYIMYCSDSAAIAHPALNMSTVLHYHDTA